MNSFDDSFVFKSSYPTSKRRNLYGAIQFPYAPKGVSDILGIFRGKPIAIEVKMAQGRISKEQSEFLATFKRFGGIAMVVRSIEELDQCIMKEFYQP